MQLEHCDRLQNNYLNPHESIYLNVLQISNLYFKRFVKGVDEKEISKVLKRILNTETYEKTSIPLTDGK